MVGAKPHCEAGPAPSSSQVGSNCPDCEAELAVLRIIPGRGGAEYWTMRCTHCGGIHLNIVEGAAASSSI
jgi:uncharacterized Zn finger protein